MAERTFEGWPFEYIQAFLTSPSDELYEELNDMAVLAHYGTPRHSGRYPWGSGKNPQRSQNFLQRADELKKQGLSEAQIAAAMGLKSSDDLRAWRKVHNYNVGVINQQKAYKLFYEDNWSKTAIAKKLGVSEGTVRNYLDPTREKRENRIAKIGDELKVMLEQKPYLDVGEGVNRQLNISEPTMTAVRKYLEDQGYEILQRKMPQVTNPTQKTTMLVLCKPGTTQKELSEHLGQITSPDGIYFEDFGDTVVKREPIQSISSKRIQVNYAETGGDQKDGVIEIRPGTDDLSLGNRNYAQVRIAVDDTHYLKGMAIYGDPKEMPPGKDIVFNTSKHEGTPVLGTDSDHTVLKKMKDDPSNPFGSTFRQWKYQDADGNEVVSPINIVNDDTDWDKWKKNLSSQFLSKQRPVVAKKQLDIRYAEMVDEFDEIKSLTNATLKKQLLEEFADNCESAAVHLKAAALPRQGAYAILPVNSLKDNEVYAPMYNPGEEVILVRHPHEGTFQIPRLIVNNENKEGQRILGKTPAHAIGINAKTAQQLSGADYDGDTVLVIPTVGQNLKTDKYLEGLKTYNHIDQYERSTDDKMCTGKSRDGKIGDGFNRGLQMGIASNLITDMTLQRASLSEVERAVKYSMCVIDAEKHNLDWQRCAQDQCIQQLKDKYQAKEDPTKPGGGASTLISKAKATAYIPERKEVYSKASMTEDELERWKNGEVIYRETGRTKKERKPVTDPAKMTADELERYNNGQKIYRDTGRIIPAETKTTNMEAHKDAYELSSGYAIENVYAAHANRMKALAQEARKEERATGNLEKNPSAVEAYKDVVGKGGSLAQKIERAELEAPKERQAQAIANSIMKTTLKNDPSLNEPDKKDKRKKLASKALENARDAVNGGHEKRYRITFTDREWEAIQAGAISDTQFRKVLRYADKNEVKKRAMPRNTKGMRSSTRARAQLLLNNGWALSAVATELGVSAETLRKEFNNFTDLKTVGGGQNG